MKAIDLVFHPHDWSFPFGISMFMHDDNNVLMLKFLCVGIAFTW